MLPQAVPVGHHDGLALDGSVPLAMPTSVERCDRGAGQAVVMPATSAVMPSTSIVFEIARLDVGAPRRRGSLCCRRPCQLDTTVALRLTAACRWRG